MSQRDKKDLADALNRMSGSPRKDEDAQPEGQEVRDDLRQDQTAPAPKSFAMPIPRDPGQARNIAAPPAPDSGGREVRLATPQPRAKDEAGSERVAAPAAKPADASASQRPPRPVQPGGAIEQAEAAAADSPLPPLPRPPSSAAFDLATQAGPQPASQPMPGGSWRQTLVPVLLTGGLMLIVLALYVLLRARPALGLELGLWAPVVLGLAGVCLLIFGVATVLRLRRQFHD